MTQSLSKPIVLYDGVCGLCNGLTQFLLKRDTRDRLRFAWLQGDVSKVVLKRHGAYSKELDTVYVVLGYGQESERLLTRSEAIIYLAGEIGGIWKLVKIGRFLPKILRDAIYKVVANNRYRLFGKYEACMMPDPRYQEKFLEV